MICFKTIKLVQPLIYCTLGNYDIKADFSFTLKAYFESKVAAQRVFKIEKCTLTYKAVRHCESFL